MDEIIDEVVAESANTDNLEQIIQVASEIVGTNHQENTPLEEVELQELDNKLAASENQNINIPNGHETPTRISVPPSSDEDNMDYDSDDDDDSKSNNSSLNQNRNSNSKKRLKGEVKRSHHNVLERKRRDLIKDSFTKLKEAVPTLSAERASRAQILKKAADFIQTQNAKNETSRADLRELIKKNNELESKLKDRPAPASTTATTTVVKSEPVKE